AQGRLFDSASAAPQNRRSMKPGGRSAKDDNDPKAAFVMTNVKILLALVLTASSLLAQNAAPAAPAFWTDQQKSAMAEHVRQDFLHAWSGYKQYAWGHDELRPLTKSYRDWYSSPTSAKAAVAGSSDASSLLMTPVDALDTMILMGLKDEADKDRELIDKQLSF